VTNLNKKNTKSSVTEIHHLIDLYGHDAFLYLLRSLVSNIDFRDPKPKDQTKLQLLHQEIVQLVKQPNFASCICQAIEAIEHLQEDFVSNFSKALKLSPQHELLIALGLAHSVDPNIKQEGLKFLKNKVADLQLATLKVLPDNVLHTLLYVLRTEGLSKQAQSVIKGMQKATPVSQTVAPLLSEGADVNIANSKEAYIRDSKKPDALVTEIAGMCHISSMMEDIGYSCCESAVSFKDLLSQFPELKEADIAQIIGVMARTHTVLEGGVALYKDFPPTTDFSVSDKADQVAKSWNLNVFIDVMKEMYPKLSWPLVVKQLDHPNFQVPDPKGLALIMGVYRKISKEPFPLDFLFEKLRDSIYGLLYPSLLIFPYCRLTHECRVMC